MRTIEIIVSPQGESTVETKGFAGQACRMPAVPGSGPRPAAVGDNGRLSFTTHSRPNSTNSNGRRRPFSHPPHPLVAPLSLDP